MQESRVQKLEQKMKIMNLVSESNSKSKILDVNFSERDLHVILYQMCREEKSEQGTVRQKLFEMGFPEESLDQVEKAGWKIYDEWTQEDYELAHKNFLKKENK